jgi:diacylglycerol kinase
MIHRLLKFLRSFVIGFSGLAHAVGSEQNMLLHFIAAAGVLVAGFALALAAWEWMVIVLCIGLVIAAECMNTALERLADRVSREADPLIKQAKDCGSAAVLVLALTAAAIGGMVFGPKFWAAAGW